MNTLTALYLVSTWFQGPDVGPGNEVDLVYDLPTQYQIAYIRNFIHLFENIRNFVRNCPKSIIISSENFCPKIKCPKIKHPKILEIDVCFPLQ